MLNVLFNINFGALVMLTVIISLFSGVLLGGLHGFLVIKKQSPWLRKTAHKPSFAHVAFDFSLRYLALLLLLGFFLFTLKVNPLVCLPSYLLTFWMAIILFVRFL